jgi:hypothetical protein
MSTHNNQSSGKQGSALGILARFFWMFIGNFILFFSIICIFEYKSGLFHTADAVFWITVAALVIVRYLDINLLDGLTATGLPASMANWTKYVTLLLICSTAVWTVSHAINYLFVNK